jgi:hypothetical protein
MRKVLGWMGALSVALAPSFAHTQVRCGVIVESSAGGSLSVDTGIMRPGAPADGVSAVGWRPPSRGDHVTLQFEWAGETGAGLPQAARAGFRFSAPPPSDTRFVFTAAGQTWAIKSDYSGDFAFGSGHDYRAWSSASESSAPGFLKAAWASHAVSVAVTSSGRTLGRASFDLGNLSARDRLLALAIAKTEKPNSHDCSTTRTEWQYYCKDSGGTNCPLFRPGSGPLRIRPVN